LALAGVLHLLAAPALAQPPARPGGPHATGPCADFGAVRQVCGLGSPEDIAALPGSPWLLISQQDPAPGQSGFAALDTRTLKTVLFTAADIAVAPDPRLADCAAPPAKVALGGMGVRRQGQDYRMVAIMHGAQDQVEVFRVSIEAKGPRLTWTGCVIAPAPYFLNDIAALPNDGFAATHMFDRAAVAADPKAQQAKLLAGEPTGYVVHWSPQTGWAKVPDSDGSFPNGIDASADGRTLYFAETYGHRVNAIGLDGANRRRMAVAMQPDNVTVSEDGSVVVAGGTGAPMVSTAGCAAFRPQGCGFASALERLDFAKGSVTPLFADDGSKMPGASVGVVAGGRLYVGTSFGDRVTVVPLKP
jgi:hypothetical protein